MDSNWLHSVITAVIAAAIALLPFLWANFRRKARIIEVVDFAKKRTDFWAQYLQVGMSATLPGTDEQTQLKRKVLSEVNEIVFDTQNELARLMWVERIRAQMTFKRLIRDPFPTGTGVVDRVSFYLMLLFDVIAVLLYFLFSWILWAVMVHPGKSKLVTIASILGGIVFLAVYSQWMRMSAYLLKWPKPKRRHASPNDSGCRECTKQQPTVERVQV